MPNRHGYPIESPHTVSPPSAHNRKPSSQNVFRGRTVARGPAVPPRFAPFARVDAFSTTSLTCGCDHTVHLHTWTSPHSPGGSMSSAARTTRRRRALAVALAGVTVAATGCTVANSRHGGYDVNTLRIVLSQEPPTLDRHRRPLQHHRTTRRTRSQQRRPSAAPVDRLAPDLAQRVDLRHPQGRHVFQRRAVYRRRRGVFHRPGRQLRFELQRRRLRLR